MDSREKARRRAERQYVRRTVRLSAIAAGILLLIAFMFSARYPLMKVRQVEGLIRAGEYDQALTAIGTNAAATAAMLKAGADYGATGENAVRVNAANADVIVAPIGMLLADGMLGEVTAEMASAIGRSDAKKILVPSARCGVAVAGVKTGTVAEYVAQAVQLAAAMIRPQ